MSNLFLYLEIDLSFSKIDKRLARARQKNHTHFWGYARP